MPQLMPLFWVSSSMMVMLLFMIMLDFFNYKLIDIFGNVNVMVKVENIKFKW